MTFILALLAIAGVILLWKLVFSNPTFGEIVDKKLHVNKHIAFTVITCIAVCGFLLNQILLVVVTLIVVAFCLGIFVTSPEADKHIATIKDKLKNGQ